MSLRATLAATVAGTLASASALAAGGPGVENHAAFGAGPAYWTAERIAAAKPMRVTRNDGIDAMSFGSANLDFTRSRLVPLSANLSKPYRLAGKLFFTIPGEGDFQCSASNIKKRLIVTAAHCMFSDGVGYHTNWTYIPGYDGSQATLAAQRPFGTWDWAFALVAPSWINTHGSLPNNGDFGILELVDQDFGHGATTISVKVGGALTPVLNHLSNTHVSMLGYPCNFDSCNIQQRNDSSDHRAGSSAAGNNAFEYGSDMTGGSSGGPWVENLGDPSAAAPTGTFAVRNAVIAVTSYGYTDPAVKILGASNFNTEFQNKVLTPSCNHKAGNC